MDMNVPLGQEVGDEARGVATYTSSGHGSGDDHFATGGMVMDPNMPSGQKYGKKHHEVPGPDDHFQGMQISQSTPDEGLFTTGGIALLHSNLGGRVGHDHFRGTAMDLAQDGGSSTLEHGEQMRIPLSAALYLSRRGRSPVHAPPPVPPARLPLAPSARRRDRMGPSRRGPPQVNCSFRAPSFGATTSRRRTRPRPHPRRPRWTRASTERRRRTATTPTSTASR